MTPYKMTQQELKKRTYSHPILCRMVSTVAGLAVTGILCAQNNVYKIPDNLYHIYQKAYRERLSQQGLHLADSMYRMACTQHDGKSQCLALSIHFLHYSKQEDTAKFEAAMKALQDKSLQTGYDQYYYWAMGYKLNRLINDMKWDEAMDYLYDNLQFAQKHNHTYGLYSGYLNLGVLHLQHGETHQAIKSFKESLAFGLKYLPEQNLSINYRRMGECYKVLGDYEEMLECADKGIRISKSSQARDNMLFIKCYALYMLGREKEFVELYDKAVKSYGLSDDSDQKVIRVTPILELKIFKLMTERLYDRAKSLIPYIAPYPEQLRIWMVYYNKTGNFEAALESQRRILKATYKLQEQAPIDEMSWMNAKINKQKLEIEKRDIDIENAKLELANTKLTLRNSSLELGHTQAARHLSQLNAENYRLSFYKKKLEAQKLRDSLSAQNIKRHTHTQELNAKKRQLDILLTVAIAVLTIILGYIIHTRRMLKKLGQSNRHLNHTLHELSIAKDKAQEADVIKTRFIHNMSHEIRTPLNTIVGFSQILSEMGDNLAPKEKEDICNRITANSDILTTLVNDILDITSLESGRYTMKEEDTDIRQVCRQAIEAVTRRKPSGVELKMYANIPEGYQAHTDGYRVKQVLVNMLTNAEKNTARGQITLSCSLQENPGMITFAVADTGCGVPPEKTEEIFERFKKLDNYKQGSGLGLNICRTIADKLDGRIYIDPNYSDGARFVFTIPAR